MSATKQTRLDNWAMFVMSRLQIFFNTTDYCDLTLQFEGNVQLKVHRVVMNTCTEYFKILEQECDLDGDVLIMPADLQADVILPIVNFIYTGTLEYQLNMFERLYQAAELMDMTVLLKFLDSQRVKVKSAKMLNTRRHMKAEKLQSPVPGRKLPVWKRKSTPVPVQINPVKPYSPDTKGSFTAEPSRFDNAPKPTRFEWPDDDINEMKPYDMLPLDTSFDSISYSSKPLLTQEEELRSANNSTVFDDLRQLPSGKITKKSPETKEKDYNLNTSLDMEDLKSYVKEQKIRSGLADYDDDEDPDDPDFVVESIDRKRKAEQAITISKKIKVCEKEKENIVEVRATSARVDHSKIISEVLKKYPHLAHKNKNLRLKILPRKSDDKPAEAELKRKIYQPIQPDPVKKLASQVQEKKRASEQTWACNLCTNNGEPVEFVLYYLYRKHMTDAHHKQFDPMECKHCGDMREGPMQMTYHMYMAHAVGPPRNVSFPKCNRCSYVAFNKEIMERHMKFHKKFACHVQCNNCKLGFTNSQTLKAHMQLAGHNGKNNLSFDCQYCTRQLNSATSLFVHCRTTHLDDAKRDGMLSLDNSHIEDDEKPAESAETESQEAEFQENIEDSFDIVVMDDQQQYIIQNEAEAGTEISSDEGFITLPATALQQQTYNVAQVGDIGSTDELVMVLTDHDYNDETENTIINNDNSNIVVLYSHPVDGEQNQYISSQGNIMLNSETGMLEIHNEGVPISTQGESIEMIQKEIQSHVSTAGATHVITTTAKSTEDSDKKVIAVEEEGTGKLINTIVETEDQDTTDFAVQNAEGNFNTDVLNVALPQEPEPMEIDEDAKSTCIVETPQKQPDEIVKEGSQDVVGLTPLLDVESGETQKEEQQKVVKGSSTDEEKMDDIDQPEEVKPISEIKPAEGPIDKSEMVGKQDNKISVCLPSEECPDEPMEVDGTVNLETLTDSIKSSCNEGKEEGNELLETSEEKVPDASISPEICPEVSTTPVQEDIKPTDININDETSDALIEEKSVSTLDEGESLPESFEEQSLDTQELSFSIPLETSVSKSKSEEDNTEGISTLLNDWEDTDSQTSDQGNKITTVNKLITDWDDE